MRQRNQGGEPMVAARDSCERRATSGWHRLANRWRSRYVRFCRYWPVVVTFCIGAAVSTILFGVASDLEAEPSRDRFVEDVRNVAASVERRLLADQEVLSSIAGLYAASYSVERKEFQAFVATALARHEQFQALEWVPLVPGTQRAVYEEAARADGYPGFEFSERDDAGRLRRAGARQAYYPVYYLEPLAENEAALGYDLGSDPKRLAALERARDTGAVAATERVKLVQETGEQFGLLLFLPIYSKGASLDNVGERRAALEGFALAVFRVGDFIEHTRDVLDTGPYGIRLHDVSAAVGQRLLYATGNSSADLGDGEQAPPGPRETVTIDVGGRQWALTVFPLAGRLRGTGLPLAAGALVAGLLMSFALASYLALALRQAGRLSRANARLKDEVAVRQRAEEALIDSDERYRHIFDNSQIGIYRAALDGRIVLANSAFMRILGCSSYDELASRNLATDGIFDRDYAERRLAALNERQGELTGFEGFWRKRDGTPVFVRESSWVVKATGGQVVYIEGTVEDISEQRRQEEQLAYYATHDPLTGLANRRSLEQHLSTFIGRAKQTKVTGYLLFLDIDNFKLVNDTVGHVAGDRVLVNMGTLLSEALRPVDLLVRLGGDEFVALVEGIAGNEASEIAERLRERISDARFMVDGHRFNLGVSIGIVEINRHSSTGEALAKADWAMYRAKQLGRNRVVVYRPGESGVSALTDANQAVSRVKEALREDRLLVYYQPIVRLTNGHIDHYEALVRIREGEDVVPPNEFLRAAERFGLMPQMTRVIIEEVIRVLGCQPEIRVFVNLSTSCLADDTLPEFIETSLRKAGVEPKRLGFEITETMVVQDLATAERWISRLKALGCQFALDDFGAGFSSLSYLLNLPVDELKIDGSLVLQVASDPKQQVLVRAIRDIAEAMGIEVVAEYVENELIAQTLESLGVSCGQGYYFGAPSPAPLSARCLDHAWRHDAPGGGAELAMTIHHPRASLARGAKPGIVRGLASTASGVSSPGRVAKVC